MVAGGISQSPKTESNLLLGGAFIIACCYVTGRLKIPVRVLQVTWKVIIHWSSQWLIHGYTQQKQGTLTFARAYQNSLAELASSILSVVKENLFWARQCLLLCLLLSRMQSSSVFLSIWTTQHKVRKTNILAAWSLVTNVPLHYQQFKIQPLSATDNIRRLWLTSANDRAALGVLIGWTTIRIGKYMWKDSVILQ